MKRLLAAAVLLCWGGAIWAADFNGDGRDDVGIFRPSSGLWSVRGITRIYFGGAGDIPVPGDYTHNGRDDIAVFRPATGLWSVRGVTRVYHGSGTDLPFGATGGRWTPKEGVLYYTGGRVGIGTADPDPRDLLTVNGGRGYFVNSSYHGIEIENSAWSCLYIHNTSYNGIDIEDCAGNFIRAGTAGGAASFTVQSTGNVGIGIAPGATTKLLVEGPSAGTAISGSSSGGYGIFGQTTTGYAGYFIGDVYINGTLSKNSGTFKIDHPLDPENRYLSHSFVESPDMLNVYNGNVVLGENGEATVELPGYFEALNRDFRYQLTPLGAPAPNLYVSRQVSGNNFAIAGGYPGLEVSWQVTGVRRDPWAERNPVIVEEDKPQGERGYYLNPEVYGRPEAESVSLARMRGLAQE